MWVSENEKGFKEKNKCLAEIMLQARNEYNQRNDRVNLYNRLIERLFQTKEGITGYLNMVYEQEVEYGYGKKSDISKEKVESAINLLSSLTEAELREVLRKLNESASGHNSQYCD